MSENKRIFVGRGMRRRPTRFQPRAVAFLIFLDFSRSSRAHGLGELLFSLWQAESCRQKADVCVCRVCRCRQRARSAASVGTARETAGGVRLHRLTAAAAAAAAAQIINGEMVAVSEAHQRVVRADKSNIAQKFGTRANQNDCTSCWSMRAPFLCVATTTQKNLFFSCVVADGFVKCICGAKLKNDARNLRRHKKGLLTACRR